MPATSHRRSTFWAARSLLWLAVLYGFALTASGPMLGAEKTLTWKAVDGAILRVDDHPLKDWNVYQAGKKNDPLLVQMGARFLLIEIRNHRIFELAPAKIEHKGADLLYDPNDRPKNPLDTSHWLVRDVGLAYRTSVKLEAEGHVIDVQIPHPLDIRNVY